MNRKKKLSRLKEALNIMADIKPVAPRPASETRELGHTVHAMVTFLDVALHEGTSAVEVIRRLGLPRSSVSRHLLYLTERDHRLLPGLALVVDKTHPSDRRRKQYYLTPKGQRLASRLAEVLNGEHGSD